LARQEEKNVSERSQFEITGTHLERDHCLKVQIKPY
jgi:hypothetical protein